MKPKLRSPCLSPTTAAKDAGWKEGRKRHTANDAAFVVGALLPHPLQLHFLKPWLRQPCPGTCLKCFCLRLNYRASGTHWGRSIHCNRMKETTTSMANTLDRTPNAIGGCGQGGWDWRLKRGDNNLALTRQAKSGARSETRRKSNPDLFSGQAIFLSLSTISKNSQYMTFTLYIC